MTPLVERSPERPGGSLGNGRQSCLPKVKHCMPPGKKKPSPMLQAARATLAMDAMASGRAINKDEAARMAGIGRQALKPSSLAPLIARSPEMRSTASLGGMLDYAAEVDGEMVTVRAALAGCADASIRTMRRIGRRSDESLTKDEQAALKRAQSLLSMAKECGLWADQGNSALPAEIERQLAAEADKMSVTRITEVAITQWNRDHRYQHGIGPEALRQHYEMQAVRTVDVELNPASVGDDANQ